MATTIYATFDTERNAERAAGALMDRGMNAADISFIIPEAVEPAHTAYHGANIPTGPDNSTPYNAPASFPSNQPARPTDIPAPDMALPPSPILSPAMGQPNRVGQAPTEVQTGPGYKYEEIDVVTIDPTPMNALAASQADGTVSVATLSSTIVSDATEHASRMPTLAGDTPIDVVEADHGPHIVDNNREQPRAARGISTTTGRDAEKGAVDGAGLGLGLGLLLGLATVAIPGVGLVAGAGALVAGLTAATGVAGAIAGGSYGFLHDMGIPPQYVQHLQDHLQSGSPILSIGVTNDVPQSEIIQLLGKYGATSMEAF